MDSANALATFEEFSPPASACCAGGTAFKQGCDSHGCQIVVSAHFAASCDGAEIFDAVDGEGAVVADAHLFLKAEYTLVDCTIAARPLSSKTTLTASRLWVPRPERTSMSFIDESGLRIRPPGQGVDFSVEDLGDGLSDADISQAGNRFWRKGGGEGSGLGLSIVRAIVSRYQGSWELTRGSGGGIVARLELPAD